MMVEIQKCSSSKKSERVSQNDRLSKIGDDKKRGGKREDEAKKSAIR